MSDTPKVKVPDFDDFFKYQRERLKESNIDTTDEALQKAVQNDDDFMLFKNQLDKHETIFDYLNGLKTFMKKQVEEFFPENEVDDRTAFLYQMIFENTLINIGKMTLTENSEMSDPLLEKSLEKAKEIYNNVPERPYALPKNSDEIFERGFIHLAHYLLEINKLATDDKTSTKDYRTAKKAKEAGATIRNKYLEVLPMITNSDYRNSISLLAQGKAYLQIVDDKKYNLKYANGNIYFTDKDGKIEKAELKNIITNEGIENIDLSLLHNCYGLIYEEFEKSGFKILNDVITIYLPDLAKYIYGNRHLNNKEYEKLLDDMKQYHGVIGVVSVPGKSIPSTYAVLNHEEYDAKTNILKFSSPYINHIIKTILKDSERKYKDGNTKLKQDGTPLLKASHSFLIKKSMERASKNKDAKENVRNIVYVIEKAGDNTPHISALTLIERNPSLKKRLETVKNKTTLLRDNFTDTWRLLREETYLIEKYKDIQLPDPENKAFIPTVKTLDTMVFEFAHKGKI